VNGYSDSMVIPNEIYIRIIISEKDSRDRVSVEESENKFITGLKNLGIDTEKYLSVNDMGSNYRFYFLKKKDVFKTKEYILKVSDAGTASKVFMMLEDLNISNSSIDRVDHSDLEKIKNVTRGRAIENAKAKAITMTVPLGQSVGSAIYISDNENVNIQNGLTGRAGGLVIRGSKSFDPYDVPKIEFEKIRVSSTVSVKFILK